MRVVLLAACAAVLAGCTAPAADEPEVVSASFSHDHSQAPPGEERFVLNATSQLSYQVTFLGLPAPAGSGWVCPLEGSDVGVDLVAPDGSVAGSFAPDARGLTGGEDCGGDEGEVARAAAGAWKVRFRGEGEAIAIVTLVAVELAG